MDNGVTNSLPLLVNIVLISKLFFFKILNKSKDLYAAIPPPMIIKIFFFLTYFIKILITSQLQYLKLI